MKSKYNICLTYYKNYDDNMLYIYPTAIFTNKQIIKKSFNYFKNTRSKKLLLITEFNHPIERAIEKNRNKYKFKNTKNMNIRSQELKKYYHDTGMLYYYKIKNYSLSNQKLFNALVVKNFSYVDINTKNDFNFAKKLINL